MVGNTLPACLASSIQPRLSRVGVVNRPSRRLVFNLVGLYVAGLIVLGLFVWFVLAALGRAPWPAN
jgi:hypothetical protein